MIPILSRAGDVLGMYGRKITPNLRDGTPLHLYLPGPHRGRQYEPILYGWREGSRHYWCGARDQGDVWLMNKPSASTIHPTMKPVELVERAILNSSQREAVVVDPFGGSGSTNG